MCYTGQTRIGAGIIDAQVRNFETGESRSIAAMDAQKALCVEMKNALLQGRLNRFGELLHEAWQQKKLMASQISNPTIDELYAEARAAGAIGGKLLGAGGGGYLLLFSPFTKKHLVAKRLDELRGQLVDFNFDARGAVTWRVPV
jgi:D-glycero-alpha-D-manno-heptose-7-phosphate kinase